MFDYFNMFDLTIIVLALAALFACVNTAVCREFWKKHVCDDFPTSYDDECFMCDHGNDACFKDPSRCAAMRKK